MDVTSELKDLAASIFKTSPLIATALASPVAGMVLSLLSAKFGVSAKPADISVAISGTDGLLKVKELEEQHFEALTAALTEQYRVQATDTANARDRQIQEERILGKRDLITPLIAIVFIIIYAMVQMYVIYHPDTQDDIISARLQDIILMVVSFYFGNSQKR